jgi:hypothetical protein
MVTAQVGRRALGGHGILTLEANENVKLRVHNIRGASQEIRYDIVMIRRYRNLVCSSKRNYAVDTGGGVASACVLQMPCFRNR